MQHTDKAKVITLKEEKLGVLLVNLGTPDSPSIKDVRRFLKQFLSDPRVVESNRIIWWCILNLIILNTRPRKTSAAYQKVWTDEGSPLMVISQKQADALQYALSSSTDESKYTYHVELAMTYGCPSISSALTNLTDSGISKIQILPLYPQYSATTTAAVFDAISKTLSSWRKLPEISYINHYHNHPLYITALVQSILEFQTIHGKPDKLVLSFHGIPQKYCDAGDPYYDECIESANLLRQQLNYNEDELIISFQSRLGPQQWLQPYTDQTLKMLAESGTKSVQILCPGFSADCLETLEEIAIENRDVFLNHGGKEFQYIPCLNDQPEHIALLTDLVKHSASHAHSCPRDKE